MNSSSSRVERTGVDGRGRWTGSGAGRLRRSCAALRAPGAAEGSDGGGVHASPWVRYHATVFSRPGSSEILGPEANLLGRPSRRAGPGLLGHLLRLVAVHDRHRAEQPAADLRARPGGPADELGDGDDLRPPAAKRPAESDAEVLPAVGVRVGGEVDALGGVLAGERLAALGGGDQRLVQVVHVHEAEVLRTHAGLEVHAGLPHGDERGEIGQVTRAVDERRADDDRRHPVGELAGGLLRGELAAPVHRDRRRRLVLGARLADARRAGGGERAADHQTGRALLPRQHRGQHPGGLGVAPEVVLLGPGLGDPRDVLHHLDALRGLVPPRRRCGGRPPRCGPRAPSARPPSRSAGPSRPPRRLARRGPSPAVRRRSRCHRSGEPSCRQTVRR